MKWLFRKPKTIKVYDQFKGKISFVDINKLQYYIGYDLPEQYKRFLTKYNGGRIEPNSFDIIGNKQGSSVQFFYGITTEINYDLKANYDQWIKCDYPKEYLPIANDGFGNYILLDLKDNYGHVFFWSHDRTELRLVEISKDFNTFLDSFYEFKLEDTDFDIAINNEDAKYFERRIENGEHIDEIKNEFGQTAMIRACLAGKLNLIKFFKDKGAKMINALFMAAGNGHMEAVKYLLSIGCDPNERYADQNNDTVLIHTAHWGYFDIAKVLMEAGADVNAVDKHGQSVLRKAIWSENQELISYLEELGAIDSYKNT